MREVVRNGVVRAAALSARWTARRDGGGGGGSSSHPRAPRILVVRPDHLGDLLLTTPAIAALRAALPHAHITALVGPWAAAALDNNPHLDRVLTLRFPGFDRDNPHVGARAYTLLGAAARQLERERNDLAIIPRHDFWWGAALTALAGIPRRVGFDLPPGRAALTDIVPAPGPDEHSVTRALRVARHAARALGADLTLPATAGPQDAPLVFATTADDRAWASAWLAGANIAPARPPIVVHPASGALIKAWPAHKWAEVLTELARATDAPVVVTGTPHERPLVEDVLRQVRTEAPVARLVEDVPLGRFAALLERARLVLGVDSGPLHLATAVGAPTVHLYGPTSPAIFGPWGPTSAHVALASPLACAPCGRLDYTAADLSAHPCVRVITPAQVVAAAHAVLSTTDALPPVAPEERSRECRSSRRGEGVGAR